VVCVDAMLGVGGKCTWGESKSGLHEANGRGLLDEADERCAKLGSLAFRIGFGAIAASSLVPEQWPT